MRDPQEIDTGTFALDSSLKLMRILLIADPDIPVPPIEYGGIERIIALLIDEYLKKGHQVSLLAGPDSKPACDCYFYGVTGAVKSKKQRGVEILEAWKFLTAQHARFDVIHNFSRLMYFLPILTSKAVKIMSYQRPITARNISFIGGLPSRRFCFTANSDSCARTGNVSGRWHTVYNGVNMGQYDFQKSVPEDAPLVFLGRLDRVKGAHTAIRVAQDAGRRLIIAGNKPHLRHEIDYFNREVEPYIDQRKIVYAGAVNDTQKNELLKQAAALLFPIEWEEPFGIVMIEALACGTPVIAFRRGAVPEVIQHGRTGFVCGSYKEMLESVGRIKNIRREDCRNDCENRFSSSKISEDYLRIYTET